MIPRVYAPGLAGAQAILEIGADEASHLIRVLRLRPGDEIRVFDGQGVERRARIQTLTKHSVRVSLGDVSESAPEPRLRLSLAQALLKADKFDAVIRDTAMLGVSVIRPLVTTYTDVPQAAWRDGGRVDRWHRVAVSSAKQCGRAVVPTIHQVATLDEALAADASDVRLILGEPALGGRRVPLDDHLARRLRDASSVFVTVGPEGGWAPAEVERAERAGCGIVSLGRRTLRADAAPVVALAVLLHAAGEF